MNTLWNRRQVLAAGVALATTPNFAGATETEAMSTRVIPATGEELPVIGLGTYQAFDVESTPAELAIRREIVDMMIRQGGSVVDTSPMYDRSEKVIGDVLSTGIDRSQLFLATKVWSDGRASGEAQMKRSTELMNTDVIDLMQVHNLRDTGTHMETIRAWQEDGRIRYSGLTHYTAGALDDLEREMTNNRPQFIQINYSLGERDADDRILPLAREMGIAVIINRPFQAGHLFRAVSSIELPGFAREFAETWGQFFLKFIVSHPAVTCVIPATSKPHHMLDNLGAGFGPLPDAAMRRNMVDFIMGL